MYNNLVIEMGKKGFMGQDLAAKLNLSEEEVKKKTRNAFYCFTLEEAEKIKSNFFPELSLEYLFSTGKTESTSNNSLAELAHNLDYELGGISLNESTFNDINTILGYLRDDMDNAKLEDVPFLFHEFHHQVRIMDDLMNYTMKNFSVNFENVNHIRYDFFHQVVRPKG